MKIGFNEKKDSLRIENLIHNNSDTKTGKSSKGMKNYKIN
jgi:hypothetical protein